MPYRDLLSPLKLVRYEIPSRQTESAVSPLDGIAFRRFSDTHRQEEAHHVLDEVYSWFAEGFDTNDLQEVKAV